MRNKEIREGFLAEYYLCPDMEGGKVGLGEKECFFRKKG